MLFMFNKLTSLVLLTFGDPLFFLTFRALAMAIASNTWEEVMKLTPAIAVMRRVLSSRPVLLISLGKRMIP